MKQTLLINNIVNWIKSFFTKKTKQPDEFIICAANYYNDRKAYETGPTNITEGFVVCGRRHHDCIFIFAKIVGFPYDAVGRSIQQTEVQGFLTNTNRFVTRKEAAIIAHKANQVITGEINPRLGLFSEDLY